MSEEPLDAQQTEVMDFDSASWKVPVSVRGFTITDAAGNVWKSSADVCRIGTHEGNDIQLDEPTVSRFHCEIRGEGRAVRIIDLESSNGLLVDGVRVKEAWLEDNSRLTLGRAELRISLLDDEVSLPVSEVGQFGSMVGRSTSMRRVFKILEKCADSESTILIEGETGTGKEEAARSIHEVSSRRDEPMIVIDCGAMPANLLESELFGHEKGSFTGASDMRKGAFEAANGGTIFIDELGEMPPELQPKLLRVLEQRTVRRVGGNEQIPIDVRVIAATNRRLELEVNEGNFRSDLYYRLAVIRVELPPLRARTEDIEMLTSTILERLDANPDQRAQILKPAFIKRLMRANWPGNVRELRNYVERSLVLEGDLPIPSDATTGEVEVINPNLSWTEARKLGVEQFEKRFLSALLEHHGDNVSQAARSAGMDRVYLHRLLRKHRLR